MGELLGTCNVSSFSNAPQYFAVKMYELQT